MEQNFKEQKGSYHQEAGDDCRGPCQLDREDRRGLQPKQTKEDGPVDSLLYEAEESVGRKHHLETMTHRLVAVVVIGILDFCESFSQKWVAIGLLFR